jgi:hypothetical protein
MDESVRKYLSEIGTKGGRVKGLARLASSHGSITPRCQLVNGSVGGYGILIGSGSGWWQKRKRSL